MTITASTTIEHLLCEESRAYRSKAVIPALQKRNRLGKTDRHTKKLHPASQPLRILSWKPEPWCRDDSIPRRSSACSHRVARCSQPDLAIRPCVTRWCPRTRLCGQGPDKVEPCRLTGPSPILATPAHVTSAAAANLHHGSARPSAIYPSRTGPGLGRAGRRLRYWSLAGETVASMGVQAARAPAAT